MDHLIYVVPDLEATLPAVEATLGIRPVLGGRHSEWGTWNALLSLGSDVYLEVVAPDPVHAAAVASRTHAGGAVGEGGERPLRPATLFGVDRVHVPRLATWCARAEPLESRVATAAAAGLEVGPLLKGGRDRPDGTRVSWRISDPTGDREGGVLPFLIAWGSTPHPAGGVPGGTTDGLTLERLSLEHPDPERIRRWLEALEIEVPVREAPAPAIEAVLNTPLGEVVHRSDAPIFPLS